MTKPRTNQNSAGKVKAQRENPTNVNMFINLEKIGFMTIPFVKTETSPG